MNFRDNLKSKWDKGVKEFNSIIECPQCGEFLRDKRRKCPYCGLVLVQDNSVNEVEMFSSTHRTPTNEGYTQQSNGKLHLEKDEIGTVSRNDSGDVFNSENRFAANGGYTQQHAKQAKKVYIGSANEDNSDGTFFSSDRAPTNIAQIKRHDVNPNEQVFFSSEANRNSYDRDKTNMTADHNSEDNPYEKLDDKKIITDHSHEYIAHNLMEFTKHRFAKALADRIEFLISAILLFSMAFSLLDFIYDRDRKTTIAVVAYYIIVCGLSLGAIKTYRKIFFHAICVFSILISIYIVIYIGAIDKYARAPEVVIFYLPVALMNIFCMRLVKRSSELYNIWDAYLKKGEDLIHIENEFEYRIYSSKDFQDDSVQIETQQQE